MYTVIKRDGKVVDFDLSKIRDAITQAFDACEKQYNPDTIDFLALKVTADFEPKITDGKILLGIGDDLAVAIHAKDNHLMFNPAPPPAEYPPK